MTPEILKNSQLQAIPADARILVVIPPPDGFVSADVAAKIKHELSEATTLAGLNLPVVVFREHWAVQVVGDTEPCGIRMTYLTYPHPPCQGVPRTIWMQKSDGGALSGTRREMLALVENLRGDAGGSGNEYEVCELPK